MSSSGSSQGGDADDVEERDGAGGASSPIPVMYRKSRTTVPWKAEEDERLRRACSQAGLSWVEIAEQVGGGRSICSCSGRWARLVKAQGLPNSSPAPKTQSKSTEAKRRKRVIVSPEEDDDDNHVPEPGPPSPVKTPVASGPSPSSSSHHRNPVQTPIPDVKPDPTPAPTTQNTSSGFFSRADDIQVPDDDELAAMEASNARLARLIAVRKRKVELSEEFRQLGEPREESTKSQVKSEDSKVVKMEDSQPSKKQKVGPGRKSKGKGRESDLIDLTLSDDD